MGTLVINLNQILKIQYGDKIFNNAQILNENWKPGLILSRLQTLVYQIVYIYLPEEKGLPWTATLH